MRETLFMSDKKYDEISNRVYESYPNACILFIDNVVNEDLLQEYEAKKTEIMEQRGSVEELLLFHGTKHSLINVIALNGFDPSKNVTSAYGKGTYFARDARYSSDYMKTADGDGISYMFLCKVLVGTKVLHSQKHDALDYYNYVDNVHNTAIYVTPEPHTAYPNYIIALYKNAK